MYGIGLPSLPTTLMNEHVAQISQVIIYRDLVKEPRALYEM